MYSCFYAFFDTDDSGVIEKKELQSLFLGFREHIDLPALNRSRMYALPLFSGIFVESVALLCTMIESVVFLGVFV